jgi:hypothetical protein
MCSPELSCAVRRVALTHSCLVAFSATLPLRIIAAEATDAVSVKIDGQLLPLADAIRQAASDERLLAYRQLREELSGTPDGEFDLAMWCRKQKLTEEERLHWWTLLALEPDDADAIRALRLQRYQGMLLTADEVEQAKRDERAAKLVAQKWLPKLSRLKQAIEHGSNAERATAIQEFRTIRDSAAIPTIERVFSLEDVALATVVVETVAKMEGDGANELLTRVAVSSPDEYLREQAAHALESRPLHSYVPRLVAELATPIELDVTTSVEPGKPITKSYTAVAYTGRLTPAFYHVHRSSGNYTNDDVAAWGLEAESSSFTGVIGYEPQKVTYNYVLTREGADEESPDKVTGAIDASESSRRAVSIEDLQEQIRQENEAAAALNERIHAVLVKTTHVDPMQSGLQATNHRGDVDPRSWWDWWNSQTQSNCSVAAGIDVWTQTGLRPIEEVLPGDRVLTRNPLSGELAFNLVTAVDERPAGPMQAIEVGSRTILVSSEQLFRVAEIGWKPAAELHSGMPIDGLNGPHRIERVGPGEAIARYSLLIANVSNFFVDQQGVLVRDSASP